MRTIDDNWQHDLTEAYLTGEMTEEEVRAEIARVRAEVMSTAPSYIGRTQDMNEEQAA